jgi:D-amino peptidase
VEGWLPGVETAVVKYALNRFSANCLPIEEAQMRIREKANASMSKIDKVKPFKLDSPYRLEVETVDPAHAHRMALLPGSEYDGNRKVNYECDDLLESHRAFLTMVALSRSEFYVNPQQF